jgi:hypothetical protein
LVGDHARLLSIGNPIEPSGAFYEEHKAPGVFKLKISALDTPNVIEGREVIPGLVTCTWVEEKKAKWGEKSPLYQSKVLGEFPDAGTNTLIPLSLVEAARARRLESGAAPVELGVDVARFGDDETVCIRRQGPIIRTQFVSSKEDTMQTTGRVIAAMRDTGAKVAKVDVIGVGSGVVDRLTEQNVPTQSMNAAHAARDKERFENVRAEWWWTMREAFEAGEIDLDPTDDVLASQLCSVRYKINSKGKIQVESKDEMKVRQLTSPDRADAAVMAYGQATASALQPFVFR